jgi:hypothetical protein
MAASEMAFGTALNFELKRDIASRMLTFPSTLKNRPFLEFALKLLASGRWLDRVISCIIWPVDRGAIFRNDMDASPGWINLELLLRTLASVHARPLVLSMPIPGDFYDQKGVSRSAREAYYVKLRTLVQSYHFPLIEFEEHDEARLFFTFTRVILLQKAGCITIKRLMISITNVCREAYK